MITVIKELLEVDGFKTIDADFEKDNHSTLISIHDARNLFYIISFFDTFDDVMRNFDRLQAEAYRKMLEYEDANMYKNNCYFVLCVNEIATADYKKVIQELEESNLYFKKYLINYSDVELDDLKRKCSGTTIREVIDGNIYDAKLFEKYKIDKNSDFYSAIMKLVIKFPHIVVNNKKKPPLESVEERIKDAVIQKGLEEVESYYTSFDEDGFKLFISQILNFEESDYE